jgi:hypothetical protein
MIDWKNLNKINLANPDPSMDLHDVVKTLLVRKLLFKHRLNLKNLLVFIQKDNSNNNNNNSRIISKKMILLI